MKAAMVPFNDPALTRVGCALPLLIVLISLAREGLTIHTRTSSLVTLLGGGRGRGQRNVERALRLLDEQGYLHRTFQRKAGTVTVVLTGKGLPPPRAKPQRMAAARRYASGATRPAGNLPIRIKGNCVDARAGLAIRLSVFERGLTRANYPVRWSMAQRCDPPAVVEAIRRRWPPEEWLP